MRRFTATLASLAWLVAAAAPAAGQADKQPAPAAEAPAEGAPAGAAAGEEAAAAAEAPAPAPARKPASLDELLERVRQGWDAERTENGRREARFQARREDQKRLLAEARATQAALEARSQDLENQFEQNEITLAQLEETLTQRLGALGELFGVVRQVAGDSRGNIENSLVSAQLPGRAEFLEKLGSSKSLPSIEELEQLWFTLHQEATELGKVVRFPATVITAEGNREQQDVIRVGAFNAIAKGKYLVWNPEVGLSELPRQPSRIYLRTVSEFEHADNGMARLAIDPSSGSILRVLVQTPSARERIEQGGPVGYTIIVLGVLAGLLALVRWVIVSNASRKVAAQKGSDRIDEGNPLGRVLSVYEENQSADTETLELKLDEAIMRESTQLERLLWAIKVVSVVAPLLGLLGTVTGMIRTFQAITLYGSGDAKMMAAGISEALVTTMLGLFVAIPLVLLHAVVSNNSKGVVEVLEEQAAGMVARRAEQGDAAV